MLLESQILPKPLAKRLILNFFHQSFLSRNVSVSRRAIGHDVINGRSQRTAKGQFNSVRERASCIASSTVGGSLGSGMSGGRSAGFINWTRRCGSKYLSIYLSIYLFGRGCTKPMILVTCLISAKRLSSYPTRENKSFTLLLCWATQLIQYVPIHNKNPVTSWQCFEMHIFNTDLLWAKLQHKTYTSAYSPDSRVYLSSTDTNTLRKIDWHNMSFHTHHIVQCIPVTNKGR